MLGLETPEIVARKKRALTYLGRGLVVALLIDLIGLSIFFSRHDLAWFLTAEFEIQRTVALVCALPVLGVLLWYGGEMVAFQTRARRAFWEKFAQDRGWTYTHVGNVKEERGRFFHLGLQRSKAEIITGEYEGYPMRMFSYIYSTQEGKHSRLHFFTVFAFKFLGTFPNLYLNYRYDTPTVSAGVRVPLPAEFENKFHLYAPEQYEIEALAVFTPDLLEELLQKDYRFDLELVDKEAIFFLPGHIGSEEGLKESFRVATALLKMFAPALNRAHFAPIGDYSPTLPS